jgi:hypothetical protein
MTRDAVWDSEMFRIRIRFTERVSGAAGSISKPIIICRMYNVASRAKRLADRIVTRAESSRIYLHVKGTRWRGEKGS